MDYSRILTRCSDVPKCRSSACKTVTLSVVCEKQIFSYMPTTFATKLISPNSFDTWNFGQHVHTESAFFFYLLHCTIIKITSSWNFAWLGLPRFSVKSVIYCPSLLFSLFLSLIFSWIALFGFMNYWCCLSLSTFSFRIPSMKSIPGKMRASVRGGRDFHLGHS